MIVFVQIMIMLLALQSSALADDELPTVDDPRLKHEADAIENDPRSKLNAENRKSRLIGELDGLGQVYQHKRDYEKALDAYNRLLKMDKNYYLDRPRRGYLLAMMNRWPEAIKDFDATEWKNKPWIAQEIAEFCVTAGRADVARRFEESLRSRIADSSLTQTVSKICMATGREDEGRRLAERACYLDLAHGDDVSAARACFDKANGYAYLPTNGLDKTKKEQLWAIVGKLIDQGKYSSSEEIKKLLEQPTFVYTSESRGSVKLDLTYMTKSPTSPILQAGMIVDENAKPHGVWIEPNVLCCGLRQDDVIEYLKSRSLEVPEKKYKAVERYYSEQERREQDHVTLISKTKWGKVSFEFSPNGVGALTNITVYCDEGGAALLPPVVIPGSRYTPWDEYVANAKADLKKRKFLQCRDNLSRAFIAWDSSDHNRVKIPDSKRGEYGELKRLFISLYRAWNKPEIAEYFEHVSRAQLLVECASVTLDHIHEDFPAVAEFRHEMWTIKAGPAFEQYVTLLVPGCHERNVSPPSPLYDTLTRELNEKSSAKIFPLSCNFLDDEDFAISAKTN